MRFYGSFEHVYAQGAVAVGFHLIAGAVDRRGHIFHERHHIAEELHHAAHAHILERAHAEHREYGAVDKSFADTFAHLVFRKMALLEEFLHQGLVVLGGCFNERLVHLLCTVHFLGGNLLYRGDSAFGPP